MTVSLIQLALALAIIGCADSFIPTVGKFFRPHTTVMVVTKDIQMPALSSTMTEGKVVAWSKKIGDKVSAGDVLLVVESDKADMDVEAFEDGYLAAIYTAEGASAAVGATVAVLVENVSDISNVGSAPPSAIIPVPVSVPVAAATATVSAAIAVATSPVVSESATLSPDKFEQVTMPALSSTMTEGKVVSWSKKVGDKISSGDMVLIVESDKADMDVESYEEGYLAVILVGEGESAAVGSPVGLMAKTVADIPSVQAYAAALKTGGAVAVAPTVVAVAATTAAVTVTVPVPVSVSTATAAAVSTGDVFVPAAGTINASPQARKLALENNLDVTKIKGTGNFGRVMPDDVLIAAGKKTVTVTAPIIAPTVTTTTATAAAVTSTPAVVKAAPASAVAQKVNMEASPIIEGVVLMDGMQKAVAKNMEKTLSAPVFRVSR